MTQRSRLFVAGLAAAMLLLVAVGSASASHLSTNETRFRIVWTSLEFVEPIFNTAVLCPTTLEGSFHSATIAKTAGLLIGAITRASVAPPGGCRNGEATILTETLPWHVQYSSFKGTLPSITGIVQRMIGAAFRIHSTISGVTCLSTTEVRHPSQGIAEIEGGVVNRMTAEPEQNIPCGSFFEGHFRGTGTVTRPGVATPDIRTTLI